MSLFVSQIALVWLIILCVVLAVVAAHTTEIVARVLALDALAFVIVGLLAVLSISQRQPFFLDIALVMALVGFVQTVATVTALLRQGSKE